MKDEKRKKHKVRRRVIFSSCKRGKKSSDSVRQEDQDDHENMIEERCEETDVLIVKPEAMRMRKKTNVYIILLFFLPHKVRKPTGQAAKQPDFS